MNLYIINLATLGFYETKKIDLSIFDLVELQRIIKNPNNRILLHAVMEFWDSDMINACLTMLGVTRTQPNVRLLVEECKKHHPFDKPINFDNILYYNACLMQNETVNLKNNSKITIDKDNFLYIVGKSYKRHRIGLLYNLHRRGLLDQCEWSFRLAEPELTRECLNDIPDEEYDSFITSVTRDLDIPTNEPIYHHTRHGWPAQTWLYENTCFTLLSETHCSPQYLAFITEKTWRAISNRHVFVSASYVNNFDLLESIGIDTFQYAMKHKKEEFTIDKRTDDIINMTVENVEHLLENKHLYRNQLVESVTNNVAALNARVTYFREIIDPCIEPLIIQPYFYKENTVDLITGQDAENAIKKLWC